MKSGKQTNNKKDRIEPIRSQGKFNPADYFTKTKPVWATDWIPLEKEEKQKKREPLAKYSAVWAHVIPYQLGEAEPRDIPAFLLTYGQGIGTVILPAWPKGQLVTAYMMKIPMSRIKERIQPFREIDRVLFEYYKQHVKGNTFDAKSGEIPPEETKEKEQQPKDDPASRPAWQARNRERADRIRKEIERRTAIEYQRRGLKPPEKDHDGHRARTRRQEDLAEEAQAQMFQGETETGKKVS